MKVKFKDGTIVNVTNCKNKTKKQIIDEARKIKKIKDTWRDYPIEVGSEYKAYEDLCEIFGQDKVDRIIVSGLNVDELSEGCSYVCSKMDYNSPYLEKDEYEDEDEEEEE